MLTAPQTQRTVPAQIGLLERPCSRFALLTTLALLTCPQFLHFQILETFWLKKKFQVGWLAYISLTKNQWNLRSTFQEGF